ncbi:MAG: MFS transporter [Candidatus Lokiarchaeota archaeon]|nr:MFS transporter [Candidatus Lokiarchaeota archaeon]
MEIVPTRKTFRSYLFFWSGQLFSLLGSMVVHFILIWWIQLETGSPIFLSLGQVFYIVPMLIFMPIAGVFSDKLKRKNLIIIVDSLQAFTTFILIMFFIFEIVNIWIIFLFIGLRSIFQAFHQPTVQAIIPSMVPKEKLGRINGINFLFVGLIQLLGPGIGALLMQFLTIRDILWVDIITFFIALIPLIIITIPVVRDESEVKQKNGFIKDFKVGFIVLKSIPGLIILLFMGMLVNFFVQPLGTLLPYFINTIHGGLEFEYALVLIFLQAGVIGGAIIASIKKEWKHKIEVSFIGIGIVGIGYALLAFVPTGFFMLIGILLLIAGITLPIINTIFQTILQTNVPQDKLGRVTSIDSTLSAIITPLGAIIAGPIAVLIGIHSLFLFCAIAIILVTLMTYFFTGIRHVKYNGHITIESESNEL